jgi:nickel/cobalt transporter (NicO) family protein
MRRWKRGLVALLAVAFFAALPLLSSGVARAHPLGNFTVNRYARLDVYSNAVQIHYVVDMAEIPTFQLISNIDSDHDGQASQPELDAYAAKERDVLSSNFSLTVAAKKRDVSVLDTSIQLLPGAGGLETMRLAVVYQVRVPDGINGDVSIGFTDQNYADRAGWKEILVRPSPGAAVNVDHSLTIDRSDALLHYPAETLQSAPDTRQVNFSWTAGTGLASPATAKTQVATIGRGSTGFAGVFSDLLRHDHTLDFVLLSLLIAFVFGMQHALGPGHGKTMVAAYLVGSKGTPKQAVILGLTVTATHTSTVYLLGAVTLVAAAYVTPETLYLWLGLVSGLMVVGFGASLFATRLWNARRGHGEPGRGNTHRHGLFGEAHSHQPHTSVQAHTHDRWHGGELLSPESSNLEPRSSAVTWRRLLGLGFIGGLLPCPSAVVVMVAAVSQGQVALGMLLIVAFSLGLAGVLIAIGVSLTLGKRIPERRKAMFQHPFVGRAVSALPVVSAFVVMVAGLAITYQAWNQPGL